LEHRAKIIGIALLCLAFGSEALTLGRLRGAAWVGRSLDITIPVQIETGEDAASLCFQADVFHADTRQDPSLVRVTLESSTQAQTATVRIKSSAPVDEPVVTVYLRTECGQKTSRRYVMLADMPSEVSIAPALPVVATPVRGAPLIAEASLPAVSESSTAAVTTAPRKRVRKASTPSNASQKSIAVEDTQSANRDKTVEKAVAPPPASRSRLKLDPLDFLSDRIADIESYAPVAASEDALRNMQRMKTLEESVASLMALNAKNEANLLDLKSRLKKAESNQYPDEVFYGLAVLLLACLAALALMWQRQRKSSNADENWWAASASGPADPETIATPVTPAVVSPVQQVSKVTAITSDSGRASEFFGHADAAHAVDVNLMEMSESGFDDLMQMKPAGERQQPPPSITEHGLDTEPLLDLLMHAEFFMSLGQADQASRLLTRQIAEAKHPNPFVYLALLSILHAQADRPNFDRLSHEFADLFNCRVPEFVVFRNEGRSLESYPTVLAAITAVWPKPESLQLLEACLVRESGESRGHPYDLAAFRDLVLLHTVASSIKKDAKVEIDDFGNHDPTTPAALEFTPFDLLANNTEYAGELDIDINLDLDFSDSQLHDTGLTPTLGTGAHFPAVTPAAEDDSADAQWLGASVMPDDGNLIDFELPSEPPPIQPESKKPAQ
jgi:pilus assembly protein FimV